MENIRTDLPSNCAENCVLTLHVRRVTSTSEGQVQKDIDIRTTKPSLIIRCLKILTATKRQGRRLLLLSLVRIDLSKSFHLSIYYLSPVLPDSFDIVKLCLKES